MHKMPYFSFRQIYPGPSYFTTLQTRMALTDHNTFCLRRLIEFWTVMKLFYIPGVVGGGGRQMWKVSIKIPSF